MKRIKISLASLALIATVSSVQAQDENNKWSIGFGVNFLLLATSVLASLLKWTVP